MGVLVIEERTGIEKHRLSSAVATAQLLNGKIITTLTESKASANAEAALTTETCGPDQKLILRLYSKEIETTVVDSCDPETVQRWTMYWTGARTHSGGYQFEFSVARAICCLGGLLPTTNPTIMSLQERHSTLCELLRTPISSRTEIKQTLLRACIENAWDTIIENADMIIASVENDSTTNDSLQKFISNCDVFYLPDVDYLPINVIDDLWNGVAPCIMTAENFSAELHSKVTSVLRPSVPMSLQIVDLRGEQPHFNPSADESSSGGADVLTPPSTVSEGVNPFANQLLIPLILRLHQQEPPAEN
jgi:hypothetical protein